MRATRFLTAACVAWCLGRGTPAHDTWLLARTPSSGEPPWVAVLDLTSGMAFPEVDHAVQRDRVATAGVRLNGKTTEVMDLASEERSLVVRARMDAPGVAAIWVQLKPRPIELTPAQVGEYLEEIGAAEVIRKEWAATPEPKRWRETYVKHAKTFVRTGEGGGPSAWADPVGLGFELVPERDPTRLRAGDELRVRLLVQGSPAPGLTVGIAGDGEAHGLLRTTDEGGRVTFRMARPGRWLLRATHLRRSPTEESDWESDFTTLTIEAR